MWEQMDELGGMSPFPTTLLQKAPGAAVPALHPALPALQLPAQLPQPQSSSHVPFTARAACDPPWTKAVQGPAQLHPTHGFHRNPQIFSCYREADSAENSTFQESVKTPHLPKALLDEDLALFMLYTPKQALIVLGLPLLSTGNPMSPPKGDRQKGHSLLPEVSLNPLQWTFIVDLGARAGKPALFSHRHPSNSPKNKRGAVGGWSQHPAPILAAARPSPSPPYLNGLVEDAVPDLDHLQVLLLLIARTFDVGHPAAVVLLAGINEVPHCAIFVEDLGGEDSSW